MQDSTHSTEKEFKIRRGRVDSVDLYEVKESELELLENGEPTGIHLNFSIFLLSIAFSAILTLCSATFTNRTIENIFLFTSIIGIIGGVYLFILWWRGRGSIKSVIKTIKRRIPPDIIREIDKNITEAPADIPAEDITTPEG